MATALFDQTRRHSGETPTAAESMQRRWQEQAHKRIAPRPSRHDNRCFDRQHLEAIAAVILLADLLSGQTNRIPNY